MRVLNVLFHVFHLGLTLFTALGWMIPSWRMFHLAVCALTLFSWFGIGLFLGKPGFCVLTELQFYVRRQLGIQSQRESYMLYLTRKLTGREPNQMTVEITTQAVFYTVTFLSLVLVTF
ncbi:MAG: DUF2784 family protein [Rhodanobacter sp.]|jgi:hypothetical protein|nr:DUF2784 family protein [Rhodanobacter sp.]